MFAKTFEKFSYTSAGISTFLLIGISYYYTTLDIKWSLFESKLINGILIFGALMLSNYAIDTVTRQLTIERSNFEVCSENIFASLPSWVSISN